MIFEGNSLLNFRSDNLSRWRIARAKVRNGTANAAVMCIGDSTTFGAQAAAGTAQRLNAYPAQLANLMTAAGLRANHQSIFGTSGPGSSLTATDSRVSLTGNWTQNGSLTSVGGPMLLASNTGTLSFAPTINVDTFDVWYLRVSGMRFNWNINGGANTLTAVLPGDNLTQKLTIPATLGANTLNIEWSVGNTYIVGINAYNSAQKEVSVWNCGWFGSSTPNWVSRFDLTWSPLATIPTLAPDVVIISIGINDWGGDRLISEYKNNLRTMVRFASQVSDVILMTPFPSATSNADPEEQRRYVEAIYAVAGEVDCPLIDMWAQFGSWDLMNTRGAYGDILHPNGVGYSDIASTISRGLLWSV